jgi:hypothetical protein
MHCTVTNWQYIRVAIDGTGIWTDDKDWTNAEVTSAQPGNTTGIAGVDNELASFLKDEYFATASASLDQYKNAVDVSLTEIKTYATGSTTVEGAIVDWIDANVVTTLHVSPSAIPVIAQSLEGASAAIKLAADFVDAYTNNDHLGTAGKDLLADGAGLLAASYFVPVLGELTGIATLGAVGGVIIAAGVSHVVKEFWTDLETTFDTDKGDSKTAGQFASDANSLIATGLNDFWTTTGTGGAQTLIDNIRAEVPILADLGSGVAHDVGVPPITLPDWATAAETPWGSAHNDESPLVLDLTEDHTGIALTTFDASTTTTFFDIDNSGFATQTAWIGDGMGLLCRDLNGNGKIDNAGELFGSSTVDGFSLLASLDSNGDHRIDANDAAWSTLQVWVDSNGDGVTQSGELHTLDDLGIKSIDLAAVAASTSTIDGNPISHTSFFTFDNGDTATIADAWFVHDPMNSAYTGDVSFDTGTMFLPDLHGFGTLPQLSIAESLDSTLKSDVSDLAYCFTMTTSFADGATLDAAITDILYRWAGVDGVDPDSRGGNFDAQKLEFLEHFYGESFTQAPHNDTPDPVGLAAGQLQDAWDAVFYNFNAELLTQLDRGRSSAARPPTTPSPAISTATKQFHRTPSRPCKPQRRPTPGRTRKPIGSKSRRLSAS